MIVSFFFPLLMPIFFAGPLLLSGGCRFCGPGCCRYVSWFLVSGPSLLNPDVEALDNPSLGRIVSPTGSTPKTPHSDLDRPDSYLSACVAVRSPVRRTHFSLLVDLSRAVWGADQASIDNHGTTRFFHAPAEGVLVQFLTGRCESPYRAHLYMWIDWSVSWVCQDVCLGAFPTSRGLPWSGLRMCQLHPDATCCDSLCPKPWLGQASNDCRSPRSAIPRFVVLPRAGVVHRFGTDEFAEHNLVGSRFLHGESFPDFWVQPPAGWSGAARARVILKVRSPACACACACTLRVVGGVPACVRLNGLIRVPLVLLGQIRIFVWIRVRRWFVAAVQMFCCGRVLVCSKNNPELMCRATTLGSSVAVECLALFNPHI